MKSVIIDLVAKSDVDNFCATNVPPNWFSALNAAGNPYFICRRFLVNNLNLGKQETSAKLLIREANEDDDWWFIKLPDDGNYTCQLSNELIERVYYAFWFLLPLNTKLVIELV